MQSVYEKTLALLYRGSRNAANNNAAIQVKKNCFVCVPPIFPKLWIRIHIEYGS